MTTLAQQGMEAYYNRDPDGLRRLLEAQALELEQLRAYVAGVAPEPRCDEATGPSGGPADTGRSERGIGPVSGLGNS